jgi:hypothetical protein
MFIENHMQVIANLMSQLDEKTFELEVNLQAFNGTLALTVGCTICGSE